MPTAAKKPEATTPPKNSRVVAMLSAQYFDHEIDEFGEKTTRVLTALQGDIIELGASEERRLDKLGALMKPGATPEQAREFAAAKLDAYRGARGDVEAQQRHNQRLLNAAPPAIATSDDDDIVRADAPIDEGITELSNWIKEAQPTADEVVALAEGDKQKATHILEAETVATGGSPRPEVVAGLQAVLDA